MSKKEMKEAGFDDYSKPEFKQKLVSDFTIEALNDVHRVNKRGLGVYKDELIGWFEEFNRYRKGSDMQLWLSFWSNKTIIVNRKNSAPIFIENPFISVAGTIQKDILSSLSKDKMDKNGFIDRILFAFSEIDVIPPFNENEMPNYKIEAYQRIINKIT